MYTLACGVLQLHNCTMVKLYTLPLKHHINLRTYVCVDIKNNKNIYTSINTEFEDTYKNYDHTHDYLQTSILSILHSLPNKHLRTYLYNHSQHSSATPVSYTHLTLPTNREV